MSSATNEMISTWIREAAGEAAGNQRNQRRYPFFRPVTLTLGEARPTQQMAFIRDINHNGIGLIHNIPLPKERLKLSIPKAPLPTAEDARVDVNVEITWNFPCGEGWYLSGGRFVGLAGIQLTTLIIRVVMSEVKRRVSQRYPFFRPLTLTIGEQNTTELPAFSRDIASAGIGLFHQVPLERQQVKLTIPRKNDVPFDVNADIAWCESCGEGWYLSGGRFKYVTLMLDELPDLLL